MRSSTPAAESLPVTALRPNDFNNRMSMARNLPSALSIVNAKLQASREIRRTNCPD
jgi:hypothetical protein